MKITFDLGNENVVTTKAEALSLVNLPDNSLGINFGNLTLLSFKNVTAVPYVAPPVPAAAPDAAPTA